MSEMMSNVEIEDVLSSIRRLVSEDFRPAAKVAATGGREKLILTPALRVVTDGPEAVPEPAAAPPLPRLHLGAAPEIEVVAATLEQAVGALGFDWESEIGDPPPDGRGYEWSSSARQRRSAPSGVTSVDVSLDPTAADDRFDRVELPEAWAQEDPGDAPYAEMVTDDEDSMAEPHDAAWADETEAEVMALLIDSAMAPATGAT